jgi:hypothetical protein
MNGETKYSPAKKTLPPEVARAIEAVLEFYWQEQLEEFLADEPEAREEHCFRSMVAIDGWFYGHEMSAEDFVRDYEGDIEAACARVRSFRG